MNVQEAYNIWAGQYDTNLNKTRDLEATALRQSIKQHAINNCLEIGCGTGKNTEWLATMATNVVAVDFSAKMLAIATQKIKAINVQFVQANIMHNWDFAGPKKFDLAVFSLVLEHFENLHTIFNKLNSVMDTNGILYIGELHPYKQYNGSKARFEKNGEVQIVPCFNHNISDFVAAAKSNHFQLLNLNEHFDDDDRNTTPRILTLLLKKI
jgi:ubiquinone/menaquinone biosynthesis C-methylase UbiE